MSTEDKLWLLVIAIIVGVFFAHWWFKSPDDRIDLTIPANDPARKQ